MKTRCLSCGGPATKKMQNGGSVDGPDEARRKIMGEKKPSLRKTLKYVKKHGSGLILKDKSKLQEGIYKPKMQKGGSTDSTKTAPYVSPKGAFYPDKKSLESGCAKNPNSPGCKKVIKTMSPAEAAKIKGRLQNGGDTSGYTNTTKGQISTVKLQKGGVKKYQNGGMTKDGKTFKFPPIPTNTTKGQLANDTSKATTPSRQTAFEKRQNKKIERAKTRSAVASIEGEGTVKDKRNNRANRIATVVGTGRQKVSRTSSTSTTSNTNSGNTNVSSGSDSGSTSGSTSGSKSGSTSGVSESGNSKIANEANTNSKNKRYQKGGSTSTKYEKYTLDNILKKKYIKRPTAKKTIVNKSSNSSVNNSGNANINNSANVNSNNKRVVITKKDNSINKSTNSRNRYQKGGSTSSVNNSGNARINNSANVNSNNKKIVITKKDNSINKSTGSRNTRIEKAKQKNVKVDRNRPIGGTYPFTFK